MAHFWMSYGRCTMPGSPMGRSEGLPRRGQVRCFHEKHQENYSSGREIQIRVTEFHASQKEPCLTPTLMDEGQARNPNTTYNEYIMEFWKFTLTWKLICPVQQKITQKEQNETTKEGGISLTIMGQKSIYNSIHKSHR